jgi:hypothetical protein
MISNEGQRTPLELASRAVSHAVGDLVLLTEDHCQPQRDWVRQLYEAQRPDRAAVGGVVETDRDASAIDWAFYYVDFFRYGGVPAEGPSPSLTVCNVSYRRDYLDEFRFLWAEFFHETAVNDALRKRFGPLWINPRAEVKMRRHVRFADALRERYAFGRLFGCTRLEFTGKGRGLLYAVFAPGLPVLLLGRMISAALRRRRNLLTFLKALPPLILMVLAWSWGEWLGYLTRCRPQSLVVAQEVFD